MTLADMWSIVKKRRVTVLITFLVVFVSVAAVTFLMPPKYTATAEIFASYSSQSGSQQSSSDMNSGASYLSTQIKTYPSLVKTQAILKPVITDLNLDVTVDELADMVTATNPTNTFMVDISVENGDAALSARIANSVANNLAERISSTLYSGDGDTSLIKLSVVQPASVPDSPSVPKIPLYLAAGFVLALVLAIAVALVKDMSSTKMDDVDEVKEISGVSSLGSVPRADILMEKTAAVVGHPASVEAEDFRRIRSNISFLTTRQAGRGHLLIITSSSPAEGKTTTCINIAAALAEEGKTVLLIDADLRHPSVARGLDIEGNVGLSHILSAQATPREVVQPYWRANLHILPAGRRVANASILLNSVLMTELMEQAQKQYDYVLVDTAPMSVSNDAAVFGRVADGIIMVVGRDVADKRDLRSIVESFHTANVKMLGFIFNFANPKKIHSKDYYYYSEESTTATHRAGSSRGRHDNS